MCCGGLSRIDELQRVQKHQLAMPRRWVPKEQVRQALAESDSSDSPYRGVDVTTLPWVLVSAQLQGAEGVAAAGGKSKGSLDFFIPPSWAIAHHLIQTWAEKKDPWFARL